jgi:NAD-dependent deacetylase
MDDAVQRAASILAVSQYVIALVGAGLSRESGIPTFRGEGGLWTRFGEPPMNQYQRFMADPRDWWLKRIEERRTPSEFSDAIERAQPNPGHIALAELERMGVLRHIITQNVDNLHQAAGSTAITEIHGNRTLLRCIGCSRREAGRDLADDEIPPVCPRCGNLVKSDTVMFGEPIPPAALAECSRQAATADVMLVIGTSGTVYPAADYPMQVLSRGGSLIEFNVDETPFTPHCAAVLRGPSGELLPRVVRALAEHQSQGPSSGRSPR